MNQGIHLVDLLLWLMGGEAEVVGASGGVAQHEIEVEDCVGLGGENRGARRKG